MEINQEAQQLLGTDWASRLIADARMLLGTAGRSADDLLNKAMAKMQAEMGVG